MRVLKHRKSEGRLNRQRHQVNTERVKMRITKGDVVRVVRGDDKGREGKVLKVYPKTGRVLVEGVNIVKKHRRARGPEEESGIISMPAPVAVSNVMLVDPKDGRPTRVRMRVDADGKKERLAVKSGEPIPRNR